jgi:hypothetical protein
MRMKVLLLAAVLAAGGIVGAKPLFVRSDQAPGGLRADVLVVGGSAAGVVAAIAAARHGMIVVLVEQRPYLGTVMTGAMLNMVDLSRGRDGNSLIKGIFSEFYNRAGGISFDPREVRKVFKSMIDGEPGVKLMLKTTVVRPLLEERQITGADVQTEDGQVVTIRAPVTIDATDDGDVAAAAGVPFTFGREESGIDRRTMPATLMFRMADVDWKTVVRVAYAFRKGRQPSGAFRGYAWGFSQFMRDYVPEDPSLSAHDLNIGRLPDGSVLINSLQVHDIDGTNTDARSAAYERARREVPRLVTYLRSNVPGFAQSHLVEVAPELYVRETRHLKGLYTLTARDIINNTRFWDRIGAASYPVDIHQYKKGEQYPYRPVRKEYTIPLRALITSKIDGLFIASRALSATYQAAGSARVIPTTMAMGEAVGVAATVAVRERVSPHQLIDHRELVEDVQKRLVRSGAVIDF